MSNKPRKGGKPKGAQLAEIETKEALRDALAGEPTHPPTRELNAFVTDVKPQGRPVKKVGFADMFAGGPQGSKPSRDKNNGGGRGF